MTIERSRYWLTLVDVIAGHTLDNAPLTFVLGAGASVTSAAPSSARVERTWMDSNTTDFPDRKSLLAEIGLRGDVEKINPLKHLFKPVSPFIGYHCLAALGHDRPIFVLNLNWDDALEQACQAVSVPFHHVTLNRDDELVFEHRRDDGEVHFAGIEESDLWEKGLLAGDPSAGVYCFHLHGRLDNRVSGIRFGVYDTLKFSPSVKKLITTRFFAHPTVVTGASLQGEYDVVDLLRTLTAEVAHSPAELSPMYVFSRQETRTDDPTDKLTQHVLYKRSSKSNFRGDPAVDFDRLLLDLATRLRKAELGSSFSSALPMPSLDELALPSCDVLETPYHPTDHYAVTIEGDAEVGKSSAAYLLGHIAYLCDREPPNVEVSSGQVACADALEALASADQAEDNRVLIVEDPFGTTGASRENPRFTRALERYLSGHDAANANGSCAGRRRLIITSRASSWRQGPFAEGLPTPHRVVSAGVDDWYSSDELTAYLESKVMPRDKPLLRREIHKKELATPAAIADAVTKATDSRKEVIREKIAFLVSISERATWYAMLARLQELWPSGVSDLPLHTDTDRESEAFAEAKLMLRSVEVDDELYVVPAHSTDREAIDHYFAENHEHFRKDLKELSARHGSPTAACELWRAIAALREDDLAPLEELPEEVRVNWGAAFLDEAARPTDEVLARMRAAEVREQLLADPLTFWAKREVVFETIRLWPLLRHDKKVHDFVAEVLENWDLGRYMVLEAMLYVQAATYPGTWDVAAYSKIWDGLAKERHRLFEEPDKHICELALLFDAFAWCPPRIEQSELRRWVEPLVEVAEDCPPLATAILCSSLHHPEGVTELGTRGVRGVHLEQRTFTEADAEIAAFLARWHFVHQSRARALRYRRDLEPANASILYRIPGGGVRTLPTEVRERCRSVIEEMARFPDHTGWAVHLAMNVAATRLGFNTTFVAKYIQDLPEADPGLITATITYEIPHPLTRALKDYFRKPANRAALLNALSNPPEIERVSVGPPMFCAARHPLPLYAVLDVVWESLETDGVPVRDPYAFREMVHAAAAEIEVGGDGVDAVSAESLHAAVAEVVSGNLQRLETAPQRRLAGDRGQMTPVECLAERLRNVADEIIDGR